MELKAAEIVMPLEAHLVRLIFGHVHKPDLTFGPLCGKNIRRQRS